MNPSSTQTPSIQKNIPFQQKNMNILAHINKKLHSKMTLLQSYQQKINTDIERITQEQNSKQKSLKSLNKNFKQKRVDIIPDEDETKDQQSTFFKQRDSYNSEKQFKISILSRAVFYPPSCSAYDLAYCKSNESIYAFGGISCTTELKQGLKQYFYQLQQGVWKQIKPVSLYTPMPRYGHTLTSTSDSLYLFGGVSEYKQKMKDRCFYADVWIFNVFKNNWRIMQFSGQAIRNRKSHTACMYNKYYIVYGGIDDSQEVISQISWLNIEEKKPKWKHRKLQGRFNHQMAICQTQQGRDFLIIFGGRNANSQIISQFLIYPIYTHENQLHIKQPTKLFSDLVPCEFPIMKLIEYGLIIMGGIDENNQTIDQCWYFNVNKQTLQFVDTGVDWGELRGAKGVGIHGNCVYVLAGSNSRKYKGIKVSLMRAYHDDLNFRL